MDATALFLSRLRFSFWGERLFVFPLLLIYTAVSCSVFRGKVRPASVSYQASAKAGAA
jgi:cytochrome bd ubiquinol oxidase subunit II